MTQNSYSFGARQQQSVSPRLQQAVRLLQMSALEFQQELQQELSRNPFLEETLDESGQEDEAGDEALVEAALLAEQTGEYSDPKAVTGQDSDASVVEGVEISALEPGEWDDLPASSFEASSPGSDQAVGSGDSDPTQWISSETSLREHLLQQICGARLSEREQLAAAIVIETLDEDGYLRDDVAETALRIELDPPLSAAEIDRGIAAVQQFEPIGIAARSLPECLTLQLRALDPETPGRGLALTLVNAHLEVLAKRDYGALQRRLDVSEAALRRAHALIRRLDPKPGQSHIGATAEYVVPDVIVVSQKGRMTAVINPEVMPRARLNRGCVDLLRQSRNGKHPAMQQQLQEARWLLRTVEQRHLTITRVANAIIKRQRAFFLYGEVALKPLLLRDIADELELHESTLSRVTSNKYMATSRGIFEFRHFFSRQLDTDAGGTCSATAVRALIKEMIEEEQRSAPLSDVALAEMLAGQGICVARRTVTKYRNQLKLASWEMRHPP